MQVRRLVVGPLDTNCWIISGEDGVPVLVIDPADNAAAILDALGGHVPHAVVLTHCHFDHLAAAAEVCEATGAPLLVHEADAPFVTCPTGTGGALFGFDDTAPHPDRELRDGDLVEAADLVFEVIHTPGHTPGCISLYGHNRLFSGDTLFAGSVGRTDFPRGDAHALRRSIAERIAPLPDDTVVHPGHGPDTTIGRERAVNPFFPRA